MKDIYYIDKVNEIKALASEHRLKILNYLVKEENTAQGLAQLLDVKQNALWYDIKKLEDTGFIELVRKEKVRGTVKKFYRAVAKNYFVDISLGDAELDRTKVVHNLIEREIEDWHRENIVDISFQDIARRIVNHNLAITENEIIAISYSPKHQKLTEDLMVEIARVGAYAIPILRTKRMEYNLIKHVPLEYATNDVIDDVILDKLDAHIIFSPGFIEEAPLSQNMIEKSNKIEEAKRKNVRETFNTDVRYLTIDTIDTKSMSDKKYIQHSEMYWKALYMDREELRKQIEFAAEKLRQASSFKIVNEENGDYLQFNFSEDKTIAFKDGCAQKKSQDTELPGGLLVTLLENCELNGEFVTDFAYFYDESFPKVKVKIENNKVVNLESKNDGERINKIFEKAIGQKERVGSLSIGTNPALQDNVDHPYINSKMLGCVSLQLGWDELEMSGVDSNLIAQLFIKNSTIYAENEIVLKKGKFINN